MWRPRRSVPRVRPACARRRIRTRPQSPCGSATPGSAKCLGPRLLAGREPTRAGWANCPLQTFEAKPPCGPKTTPTAQRLRRCRGKTATSPPPDRTACAAARLRRAARPVGPLPGPAPSQTAQRSTSPRPWPTEGNWGLQMHQNPGSSACTRGCLGTACIQNRPPPRGATDRLGHPGRRLPPPP